MEDTKTKMILELNQKRVHKILRRNGIDPDKVPPLEGTYEERSRKRTAQVMANNDKRIDKIMRKYR
ncbi:MAG: hypothetical protein IJA62_00240 [Ruminococcus sp.]|nr:hypothetical protein [Ruminococcus sp.]